MTLTDGAELYICVILTLEFWYDYWYNTRENRIKRRKNAEKSKKEKVDKQGLREGTGILLQETKGKMCDLPKAPESIQEKVEP